MEIWFIILVTISAALLLKATLNLLSPPNSNSSSPPLPPGPRTVPLIGPFLWLRKIRSGFEPILRNLHAKFGPIITIRILHRPSIFIADRNLAHQALVQNGVVFSDRPTPLPTSKIISSNQHNINSAAYGPTWRLLRRNLTAEILHPSRIKSYSHARNWVLQILIDRLNSEINGGGAGAAVQVVNHFQYAMFCLLVLMCFGDKLDENQIKLIEDSQRRLLLNINKFNYLNFWPRFTKIFLGHKWAEFLNIRKGQDETLIPLIRARKQIKERKLNNVDDDGYVLAYVDTLLDLQLPEVEGKRKLDEGEMVSLCSEFLNAGTDTTSTALQWIMANLVKYPNVQEKLFNEIQGVMGENGGGDEVKEEDLQKMPYLKAVLLEGLRRHPPGHFVLPHTVTEDAVLGGYLVPKGSNVNFLVAEMGWDPKMWEDPMEFKPERFLSSGGGEVEFDITGSREIKMMPFGAGRRICPGLGLALLHLEYFVANLVWKFEWKAVEGDEVSLEEKQEFTTVMKYPLKAQISPRKG